MVITENTQQCEAIFCVLQRPNTQCATPTLTPTPTRNCPHRVNGHGGMPRPLAAEGPTTALSSPEGTLPSSVPTLLFAAPLAARGSNGKGARGGCCQPMCDRATVLGVVGGGTPPPPGQNPLGSGPDQAQPPRKGVSYLDKDVGT